MNYPHRRWLRAAALTGLVALFPSLAACSDDDPAAPAPETIADIVAASADFSTLGAALDAAELTATFDGPGPFTVFAPTNAAFAAIPKADLDALLADKDALAAVLTYHVVSGRVDAAAVTGLSEATTLEGRKIDIAIVEGAVILNGTVKVTATDLPAANGLIHVIDAVLMPPAPPVDEPTIAEIVATNPDFSTLKAALEAAELTAALDGAGPFTVFAPTNAAFAAIPAADLNALLADKEALTDVLLYHVRDGEADATAVTAASHLTMKNGAIVPITVGASGAMIQGAKITSTDVAAANGLIHIIDAVITPPPTLAEIAASNADFETLYAAVGAAGLGGALDSAGPFTVFAPTDAAFAAVPSADLDALLADVPALNNVLLYHVADGIVPSSVAAGLTTAAMKNGQSIALSYDAMDGILTLNGSSEVVGADVWARNGVIHIIDAVLFPAAQ